MASIRLSDNDKRNIELVQSKVPELKSESAVFKYCLSIIASAYESFNTKLVLKEND
jgi:endo-1,4-beta-D-glucanase Y